MLSSGELTSMREMAATALPDTCVLRTSQFVSDGGGGGTTSWVASGTANCRFAPLTQNEREVGDRITAEADAIVTLPFGTSVTTEMQLLIDGGTYRVEAVRDRSWELTVRAEVAKET